MATDTKRERCGKDVEVMFYPGVPCNRIKGHDGEHKAAPPPDEAADEPIDTTALPEGTSGSVVTSTTELEGVPV
jgi:hypothetical protein